MSSNTTSKEPEIDFVCGLEAAALLNCVASKQYSDVKCKPLLQKLRSCCEKKVSFRSSANDQPVPSVLSESLTDDTAESGEVQLFSRPGAPPRSIKS